jgi:hypothetical protein
MAGKDFAQDGIVVALLIGIMFILTSAQTTEFMPFLSFTTIIVGALLVYGILKSGKMVVLKYWDYFLAGLGIILIGIGQYLKEIPVFMEYSLGDTGWGLLVIMTLFLLLKVILSIDFTRRLVLPK